jgi:YVTN family beta-propeller protein
MAQSNLLQLAQEGDANAIAALMNTSLQVIGVSARAVLRDGDLHVLLESERALAPSPAIEFIRRGLIRLGLEWITSTVIYSRILGQSVPNWVQQFSLKTPDLEINPFVLDSTTVINSAAPLEPEAPVESATLEAAGKPPLFPPLPPLNQASPMTLWLSVPLMFVLSSTIIWFRYLWGDAPQVTVGTVNSSPSPKTVAPPGEDKPNASLKAAANSSTDKPGDQPEAGSKVGIPASDNKSDFVSLAKDEGYQAYLIGKAAQSKQDWQKAAVHWRRAIALLKAVPDTDPQQAIAQEKLTEYQGHLDFVMREKLGNPGMELVKTITGTISPKSVVSSDNGLFFAQNMMYNHSITVYNRQYELVKTISDEINLADYGYPQFQGSQHGAPVEAAFTKDGGTAWVSNYQMYGARFSSSADDDCSPEQNNEASFLYRIGTQKLAIDKVVQVGAVPKYVATTPDNRYVLASNWCSWDVSVVDPQQNKEIRRIQLGPYPRGIAVDNAAQIAYVAVMGSYDVAAINLKDFSVSWLKDIGHSPRHLNLDPSGKFLYATLNGEGQVAKIDLASKAVVAKVATGTSPRSMAISNDGQFLYVVNYDSDTVSKIRTSDMQAVQSVAVNTAPIGITYDEGTNQVWVACYSGSIQVFQD